MSILHQLGKSSIDGYLKCWRLLPTTLQEKKESYEEAMGSEVQSGEEHVKISTEIEDNNYFWFGSTSTS